MSETMAAMVDANRFHDIGRRGKGVFLACAAQDRRMDGVGVAASNGVVDEMLVRRSRGGVYLVEQAQVCIEKRL